jgi:endonuclease-3
MADAPLGEARDYLCELPGVGRKTAACVLLFSYGRHDVPVDTHVHRVGTRLGLFRENASLDECHDAMLRLSAGADPLEAHVALIRHGRRICVARGPRCAECPLLWTCPYGRSTLVE